MKVIKPLTNLPDDDGFYAKVERDDGQELALVPLTFGRARVTLGPPSYWTGYEHGW